MASPHRASMRQPGFGGAAHTTPSKSGAGTPRRGAAVYQPPSPSPAAFRAHRVTYDVSDVLLGCWGSPGPRRTPSKALQQQPAPLPAAQAQADTTPPRREHGGGSHPHSQGAAAAPVAAALQLLTTANEGGVHQPGVSPPRSPYLPPHAALATTPTRPFVPPMRQPMMDVTPTRPSVLRPPLAATPPRSGVHQALLDMTPPRSRAQEPVSLFPNAAHHGPQTGHELMMTPPKPSAGQALGAGAGAPIAHPSPAKTPSSATKRVRDAAAAVLAAARRRTPVSTRVSTRRSSARLQGLGEPCKEGDQEEGQPVPVLPSAPPSTNTRSRKRGRASGAAEAGVTPPLSGSKTAAAAATAGTANVSTRARRASTRSAGAVPRYTCDLSGGESESAMCEMSGEESEYSGKEEESGSEWEEVEAGTLGGEQPSSRWVGGYVEAANIVCCASIPAHLVRS